MNYRILIALTLFSGALFLQPLTAQKRKKAKAQLAENPAFTPAAQRLAGFDKRKSLIENSLVSRVPFRSVGPTVMSGRVVDVDVSPTDPSIFYAAYASGGLWKTTSNGTSFTSLFDEEAVMTIGDIAVDWKNGETIWLGSGENNSSRSSYAGSGIYKSTDKGINWSFMGLPETHHIGRIIIHPENPDVVWVAALGHLYSENAERGVYKTTDGGKTWNKTLFVNDRTGIVDLTIDPSNPDVLYAAAWERIRYAWHFEGSGEGSGIYKSTDGGVSWELITPGDNGFPHTKGTGRIGLAVAPSDPQIVYAMLDNQDFRDKKEEEAHVVNKAILQTVSTETFLAFADKDINDFLDRHNFPNHYHAADIKKQVEKGEVAPSDLVLYLQDANTMLFDTPVKGAEVYRSDDGGKSWTKTHEDYIDDLVFTYGYYFGQIRVSPQNPDKIFTVGVPIIRSDDGGKTWKSIQGDNVHADHHALWLNPARNGHMVLGNDGGINISYDDGESWIKSNPIPVGQFYSVNVDMATPYHIYGGLQDNGVWEGPATYNASDRWHQSGKYPYQSIMGGDGMQVEIDTRDNATIYTGFQFGNYFRLNKKTGKRKYITPVHTLGDSPLRFNWQAPIYLSRHNQDILYMGSHRFHRSLNQGEDFETLSGDLTKGGKKGNVPYGTLTTIHESPLKFGLLYVGSDDGLVHVSKDGGYSWESISGGLPQAMWVSRVQASSFKEGRVYLSLNGYRWDNFEAMVYRSEDYGKTWKRIGLDLPDEPVNVLKEDPDNPNILYVGTDHGVYTSLNGGESFMAFYKDLPAVAVHDLVIHPREKELVLGTHGRSFYVADVKALQQLTKEVLAENLHLFNVAPKQYSERWGGPGWSEWADGVSPETSITFYCRNAETVTLQIMAEDQVLKVLTYDAEPGLNYLTYDYTLDENNKAAYQTWLNANQKDKDAENIELKAAENGNFYLQPGKYKLYLSSREAGKEGVLEIKAPKSKPARKPQKKTP